MSTHRGRLDEPGFMDQLLADVAATPREHWLAMMAQYENEKPGDIVLPGIPLDRIRKPSPSPAPKPKKAPRKDRRAA